MPARAALPTEINGGWLDRYTVAHFAAGSLMNLYTKGRCPAWGAFAMAVGWEVLEWWMKNKWPALFHPYDTQDSVQNMGVDIAAVMAGYWLAGKLPDGAWL